MLAPILSAPCAGRGFRLPFPGRHKMPGDIRLCSARSAAAARARGTRAAGPKETFSARPGWKGRGRNHPCPPAASFPSDTPASFQALVMHRFPGTRERGVESLINSAQSALTVLNKGWRLSDVVSII